MRNVLSQFNINMEFRAELDAYYTCLNGPTRDELRYILDPKEVHEVDFPGETFHVLKEKINHGYI